VADGDERRARLLGDQPLERNEVNIPIIRLRDDFDPGAGPLGRLPARYSIAAGLPQVIAAQMAHQSGGGMEEGPGGCH